MKLFFAGAEIPSHRKVLAEVGAKNVALSYMGLRRRVKFAKPWLIQEKFPEATSVFLDSGAYTVNKDPAAYTQRDLKEISEHYQQFVTENLDRLAMVSEFDALALGKDWIERQREAFYDDLDPDRFVAIWHPEWGLDYLREMGRRYPRIGIPTTDMSGRNLTPVLNQMAGEGNLLHGVAMTHVDEMQEIRWDSVSSTSWVSPQQYGDTIVWTGRELKRYPKKYKDQARRRYRTLFEREGFDAEKIANDDSTELLRLSIWSWEKLVDDIEKKGQRGLHVVTRQPEGDDHEFAEVEGDLVDTTTGEVRKPVSTEVQIAKRRDTVPLPILGVTTHTEMDGDGEEREVSQFNVRGTSERKCVTCFLASKCPAFEENSTCAFDIPVDVETKQDFVQVQNSLIKIQTQRVLFMRYAEEMEGGYADPNLSSEMDRLQKMLKTKSDMEQEGFSLSIQAKGSGPSAGQTGMISRLFGADAAKKTHELPGGPISVESAVEIIDGELVDPQ